MRNDDSWRTATFWYAFLPSIEPTFVALAGLSISRKRSLLISSIDSPSCHFPSFSSLAATNHIISPRVTDVRVKGIRAYSNPGRVRGMVMSSCRLTRIRPNYQGRTPFSPSSSSHPCLHTLVPKVTHKDTQIGVCKGRPTLLLLLYGSKADWHAQTLHCISFYRGCSLLSDTNVCRSLVVDVAMASGERAGMSAMHRDWRPPLADARIANPPIMSGCI